jgi:hypothetical protein
MMYGYGGDAKGAALLVLGYATVAADVVGLGKTDAAGESDMT